MNLRKTKQFLTLKFIKLFYYFFPGCTMTDGLDTDEEFELLG